MQVCIQSCYLSAASVKNQERYLVIVNISRNINKQHVNVIKVGFLCLMRARNVHPKPPHSPFAPPTLTQVSRHRPGELREERVQTANHPSHPSDPPPQC